MDDVALANYIAGFDLGNVEAGRVDRTCADLLGVPVGTKIWFSDYTFLKLRQRHGEINFAHYRHMPSILLDGYLARGRAPNLVELWWIGISDRETMGFFVVLKSTKRSEVFVETFHRVHSKETRRLCRKARRDNLLVREQMNFQTTTGHKEWVA